MKTPDKNFMIRFWAGALTEKEQQTLRLWMAQHPEEAREWENFKSEMLQTENLLISYKPEVQPPAGYWNEFMPRLWDKVEQTSHPKVRFKRWLPVIAPALAAAALLLIFLLPDKTANNLSEDWLISFSSEEIVENLLIQKQISQEELFAYSNGTAELYWEDESMVYSVINQDVLPLDAEESLQKMDDETRNEVLRELSATIR